MKTIEQELKMKSFPNIYTKTDVNLLFTSGWLNTQLHHFFKQYGISVQQYNVLRILRGQHPDAVMLSQITDRMVDKMSNATRLVDKLVQKEFTTRIPNEKSRRQVDIKITEKGLKLLEEIDIELNVKIPPARYANISIKDLEQLNELLDKLRN